MHKVGWDACLLGCLLGSGMEWNERGEREHSSESARKRNPTTIDELLEWCSILACGLKGALAISFLLQLRGFACALVQLESTYVCMYTWTIIAHTIVREGIDLQIGVDPGFWFIQGLLIVENVIYISWRRECYMHACVYVKQNGSAGCLQTFENDRKDN